MTNSYLDLVKQTFNFPQEGIDVEDGKHLWVGEPMVHLVLSEIVRVITPSKLPLPTEI